MAVPLSFDFSNVTNASYMCAYNTAITSFSSEAWNLSNATNISYLLSSCSMLMDATIAIDNVTSATSMLGSNYNLQSLKFVGKESRTIAAWPGDISLAYSSMSAEALKDFFDTLPPTSTTRAIDIRYTPAALSSNIDSIIAIAVGLGYSVTM